MLSPAHLRALLHPVPAPKHDDSLPPTVFRQCPHRDCWHTIAWTLQRDGAYRPTRCFAHEGAA